MESAPSPAPGTKLHLSLDYRVLVLVLLAVITAMLIVWHPWSAVSASSRTVTVTGETTIKAEPDEYVFSPSYEFKSTDKQTAIDQATAKQNELVAKLKSLGVTDKQVKTDINGYEGYDYTTGGEGRPSQYTYTLSLDITLPSKSAAQQIQAYVTTTSPTNAVTPYANFSQGLRSKLQSQARDAATKDARSKADQSAHNLGFTVSKVKSVTDDANFDQAYPISDSLNSGASQSVGTGADKAIPSIQAGQNDLSYSVTVVYYIR